MASETSVPNSAVFGVYLERGLIEGWTTEHKFGYNADIGTTFETVWDEGGLYSYVSSATTFKISSSSTDDDVGGTGALTVQIYGLDGNWDLQNETITLTGRTAVNTANTYLRIWRGVVRSAGSGGTNAGDIYAGTGTVTDGVPANKYLKIVTGNAQTLMNIYTIPRNKKGYMCSWHGGAGASKLTTIRLVLRPTGEVFQVKDQHVLFRTHNQFKHDNIPDEIAGKTDIEIRAKVDASTGDVTGGFHIILIDD